MIRMWINQPSTLQDHHKLHGTNVLATHETGDLWRVYFLSGSVVSMVMNLRCLSRGWREQQTTDHAEAIAKLITEANARAMLAETDQLCWVEYTLLDPNNIPRLYAMRVWNRLMDLIEAAKIEVK